MIAFLNALWITCILFARAFVWLVVWVALTNGIVWMVDGS
jgi:hypothetical protein